MSDKNITATGRAINDDYKRSPGKFRLTFDSMKSPFAGFYWIVRVGEIESGETQYPWAIVSVPFQTSVFVLARDVKIFRTQYQEAVLQMLEDLGFKFFFNKPIETFHGPKCTYGK